MRLLSKPEATKALQHLFGLFEKEKSKNKASGLLVMIGAVNNCLSKKQLQKLYELQDSKSKVIREGLITALLGLNNPEVIDICIKLSKDKYSKIRYWAVCNLMNYVEINSEKINEVYWNSLRDNNKRIREVALRGLAYNKDIRVKALIKKKFKKNPDLGVELMLAFDDMELLVFAKQHSDILKNNSQYLELIEQRINEKRTEK